MSSDALVVTLRQHDEYELTRSALQIMEIEESLPAPDIVIIRRAGLPLTPAADYLCDMFRRAGAQYVAGHPLPGSPRGAASRRK